MIAEDQEPSDLGMAVCCVCLRLVLDYDVCVKCGENFCPEHGFMEVCDKCWEKV